MKIDLDDEAADALVVCMLQEDARTQVEMLVKCLRGDSSQMTSDVAGLVRLLDAINAVLKYYGGESAIVKVPDVWSFER